MMISAPLVRSSLISCPSCPVLPAVVVARPGLGLFPWGVEPLGDLPDLGALAGVLSLCLGGEQGDEGSVLACWWKPEHTCFSQTELQPQHGLPFLILV